MVYFLIKNLLKLYFILFYRMRVYGADNIPQTGSVIFAPNHVSFYDTLAFGPYVPRKLHFMTTKDFVRIPVIGAIIRTMGGFEIDLKRRDKSAYERSLEILRSGKTLVVFPEGSRTLAREMGPFQQGCARLALVTGATIVPVTLVGLSEIWPRTRKFPRFFKTIRIYFHKPITVEKCEDRVELKKRIQELNEQIRAPLERRLDKHRRYLLTKSPEHNKFDRRTVS